MAYLLLSEMNEKKRKYFVDFIDLERQSLLPTYPKDQNHVVRGKN